MAEKGGPASGALKDDRFRVWIRREKHAHTIAELEPLSDAERNPRVQVLLGITLTNGRRITGDRPGFFVGKASMAVGLLAAVNDSGLALVDANASGAGRGRTTTSAGGWQGLLCSPSPRSTRQTRKHRRPSAPRLLPEFISRLGARNSNLKSRSPVGAWSCETAIGRTEMGTQGPKLHMQDLAHRDRRSVSAMLRGKGDGREKPYLEFEKHSALVDPLLDDEKIGEFYRRHCLEKEQAAAAKLSSPFSRMKKGRWKFVAGHLVMGTLMGAVLFMVSSFIGW